MIFWHKLCSFVIITYFGDFKLLSLLPSLSDYSSKLNLSMTLMDTIVGFQSGHDVSYCLLKNGKPLIHEELERFTRVKEELGDGLKFF